MNESTISSTAKEPGSSNYYTIRYALLGAAFGLIFPLMATLIVLWDIGVPLTLGNIIEVQRKEPLLWIIDTAPLFLGLFAAIAGQREDRLQGSRRQLQEMVRSLEERVTDRIRDLDRAVEVGHSVTQVRDLDEMLSEAVELIRSSFDLYYVQVFLVDAAGRNLVLRAGTGTAGTTMVNQRRRMPVNLASITGAAAIERQTIVVANTTTSHLFQPNPLLPSTRSEMAMPLLVGERLIGVLDLQSDTPDRLTEENLPALEAVAGQLAIATENAQLVAEATEARSEIETQARQMARTGWQDFLNALERSEFLGYAYDSETVVPIDAPPQLEGDYTLSIPITVTGEAIGEILIQGDEEKHWTEDEATLASAVADQIARQIENLRLLAEADRYRAEAEAATRRLTREGWDAYLQEPENQIIGYFYDRKRVRPLPSKPAQDDPQSSTLSRPLTVRGEQVGRLEVDKIKESDPEASEVVAAVAEQLSAHLESLRLTEQRERALAETEEQAQRLTKLNELGQTLAGASTLDEIYAIVASRLTQIVTSDRASIAMLHESRDRFEVLALRGERGATRVGDVVLTERSALGMAIKEDRMVVVHESADTGIPGIESIMVAPLKAGGRTFGTLNVSRRVPHAYNQSDQRLLLQVASLLASSIESQRLFEQVQARARRERILREVTATVRGTADVDSIMRKAAQEVGQALGRRAFVFLSDSKQEEQPTKPAEES